MKREPEKLQRKSFSAELRGAGRSSLTICGLLAASVAFGSERGRCFHSISAQGRRAG
jgi:hypothetical protein